MFCLLFESQPLTQGFYSLNNNNIVLEEGLVILPWDSPDNNTILDEGSTNPSHDNPWWKYHVRGGVNGHLSRITLTRILCSSRGHLTLAYDTLDKNIIFVKGSIEPSSGLPINDKISSRKHCLTLIVVTYTRIVCLRMVP